MMYFIFAVKKIDVSGNFKRCLDEFYLCVFISEYLTRLNIRCNLLKGLCQGTVTLNQHSLLYLVFIYTELI